MTARLSLHTAGDQWTLELDGEHFAAGEIPPEDPDGFEHGAAIRAGAAAAATLEGVQELAVHAVLRFLGLDPLDDGSD